MKKIDLIRNILLDELKSGTKAEIVILVFSELNEEGKIIKCADFRYISNIIGRTSYYEGIRKLKEKGIILDDKILNPKREQNNQSKQEYTKLEKQKEKRDEEDIRCINIILF